MFSTEHLLFLKKEKKRKKIIRSFQLLIIFLFFIIWQLLADLSIINTFITSSPKNVILTIITLNKDGLFVHIWVTIYETIISFSLGTIIGLIISTILWWNKLLFKILDPYLTILNSLPKVALGPIIIIWCGSGIKSIILMALFISVIITIINITTCFNQIDQNKINLLKSFKASKKQIFWKLIFPSSFYNIISSLKINISMSLIGLSPLVGEYFNIYYNKYLPHYL